MNLSADQTDALRSIMAALDSRSSEPAVLVGAAGTGKTTLLSSVAEALAERRRAITFAAPTGRAAKVLTEKLRARGLGYGAMTIHRALYSSAQETDEGLKFDGKREPVCAGGVLIIDEASMVDQRLHGDIMARMPPRASLLYVGDREQLPPVAGPWGADFDHPTATLTEVHRQALESPIVRIATGLRAGKRLPRSREPGYLRTSASSQDAAAWLVEAVAAGDDAVLLAATNGSKININALVREQLGLAGGPAIVAGDRLVVTTNSYEVDLMNGETIDIITSSEIKPGLFEVTTSTGKIFCIPSELMGLSTGRFNAAYREADTDFDETWVHADYGWCLTVHKSQGSEWRRVGVALDDAFTRWWRRDPELGRRLLYTAVTRARDELVAFDI